MDSESTIDHWHSISAAVLMSAASAAIFLLLPMIVGSMVESLGLREDQAGYTISSYFSGYALVCISAFFWIRKVNWRYLTLGGYAFLLCGLLASSWLASEWLLIALFVAGMGAGVLLGLGVTLISDMSNPDRVFGFQMLTQQALPAVLLFSLPMLLPADYSFGALIIAICIALAVTSVSIFGVPARGRQLTSEAKVLFSWRRDWRVLAMLLSVGAYFSALSGIWAYVERFADAQSISSDDVSFALAIALVGGAGGGLLAAFIAGRYSRVKILLVTTLVFLLVFFVFANDFSLWLFLVSSFLFSFVWNVNLAFQQGLISALDRSGRYMVLLPAVLAVGAVVGPVVGGFMVGGGGYNLLLLVMAVALVVCSMPFILVDSSQSEYTPDKQEVPLVD